MALDHVHQWRLLHENAEGFHSKRDDNQTTDVRWYVGKVMACLRCPEMEMRVPGHFPVEVTLATESEVRNAEKITAA